jgi:GH35 family endo-1,4-beta-xylanase
MGIVAAIAALLVSQSAPAGGTSLLGPDPMGALALLGETAAGKMSSVSVSGQPFGSAIRIETLRQVPNDWNFQIGAWSTAAVEEGDAVLASFWVRAERGQPETGEARAVFALATNGPDWSSSIRQFISVGSAWRKFDIPFRIRYSRPAGQSIIAFSLGFPPQALELADFKIVNYGKTVAVESLPRTRAEYAGQEPDAPWRKQAQARIEQIRKGNLAFVVQGPNGRPVPNAQIAVRLTKHAFHFGTGVASDALLRDDADSRKYREILKEHFNQVAIENHLKWPFWEEWARDDGLKSLAWLRANKFPIRAHNLIWPGWSNLPSDLPKLANDKDALRKRIRERFAEATAATKGMVDEWDVANETYSNNDLQRILGRDELAEWFRLAKLGDPKPRLTLNDYPSLDIAGLKSDPHLRYFDEEIANLIRLKAPIEAIGFQCHFGSNVVPPERVLKALDHFGRYKLPIVITEFDMDTQDEELQARYMRDFMTAAFSHPTIAGITQWGFWETRHWMPNAALWRKDWSIRPHGQVYLDLIHKEWATNSRGRTSRTGSWGSRAFFGTYEVTVTAPGSGTKTFTIDFPKASSKPTVLKL